MQSLATARPPGRPRCDTTRKAVLLAAYDLLAEGGLNRFTIEAVAARSGVARTTIYRWWPTKGALAMAGFMEATAADLALPPSDSVATDIPALLRLFARLLRGKAGRIIRCIIAEGQSHPETIDAFVTGFVTPAGQRSEPSSSAASKRESCGRIWMSRWRCTTCSARCIFACC